MEHVTLSVQAFAVTRDETRLIRTAARLTGDSEVMGALGHYLGVRKEMSARPSQKPRITEREKQQSPVFNEIASMPQLVEWSPESGIDSLRYLYGPLMARAAMSCVQTALEENLLQGDVQNFAEGFVESYKLVG